MKLLKCPKCGEMFADSYKECPFCQEDEAYLTTDKKTKGPGRRLEKSKSPSILGPALIVVLVLLAVFLAYTFFGDKIAELFDGTDKPAVTDHVDDPADALTIDKTELKLTVGDSAVLTASGAEKYQWNSDNSAVASVDENGKVVAVADGTATITVAAGDASASCVVTVEKKAEPKPEENKPDETKPEEAKPDETKPEETKKNLKLVADVNPDLPKDGDAYDFGMSVGDEFVLSVEGTDSKVTWESGDTSKVTISADGTIKRVADGEVNITATVDGQTIKALVR